MAQLPGGGQPGVPGGRSAWIWGLQRRYFPTFVAIVNFLHALSHIFTAAKAATAYAQGRWELFDGWAETHPVI